MLNKILQQKSSRKKYEEKSFSLPLITCTNDNKISIDVRILGARMSAPRLALP